MTDDETIVRRVDAVCSDLMNSTKARYAASCSNGSNGGRPMKYDPETIRQLRDTGLSQQQIADQLGCSKKTVQRALGDDEDEI